MEAASALASPTAVVGLISHRHSLSQDSNDSGGSGTSSVVNVPPTHSRLPPDGHEFPPDYVDPSSAGGTDGQNLLLSRKSSDSSTGSLEKPSSAVTRKNLLRHDERSIKSVKDKIALFSSSSGRGNSGGGGSGGSGSTFHHQSSEDVTAASTTSSSSALLGRLNSAAGFLTRAHTHGDVRYDGGGGGGGGGGSGGGGTKQQDHIHNKMVLNFKEERIGARRSLHLHNAPVAQARSQSLMEIGCPRYLNQHSGPSNQTLPKRQGQGGKEAPELQRRRNTVAKIKDIAIPEGRQEEGRAGPGDIAQWVIAGSAGTKDATTTTTTTRSPPFGLRRGESGSRTSPPLSPARLPSCRQGAKTSLVASSPGGGGLRDGGAEKKEASPTQIPPRRGSHAGGNSVLDAIARHRVETQYEQNRRKTSISEFRAIEARELGGKSTSSPQQRGAVCAGSHPVTASGAGAGVGTITSLGKPASRSSSFTIAERKKSFEALSKGCATTSSVNPMPPVAKRISSGASPHHQLKHHCSQDSLATRRVSREVLLEGGGGSGSNNFSSVSSVASNTSWRSSRDTITEDPDSDPAAPDATVANNNNSSRRSSRSEADGGSRVTTPTKATTTGASFGDQVEDRSASVTPTTTTSDRSATHYYSNRSEEPVGTPKADGEYYARTTSVVSKDSGFSAEEGVVVDKEESRDDKWPWRGSKLATEAERPAGSGSSLAAKEGGLTSPSAGKSIRELTERFESSPDGSLTPPVATPTAPTPTAPTATASPAFSSRKEETALSSRKAGLVATHCRAEEASTSFRLGEHPPNFSWLEESLQASKPLFYLPEESTEWESFDPSETEFTNFNRQAAALPMTSSPMPTPSPAPAHRSAADPFRKYSVPSDRDRAREKKREGNSVPLRPCSLVELGATDIAAAFEVGRLGARSSTAGAGAADGEHRISSSTNSQGSSQADLLSDVGCSASQTDEVLVPSPGAPVGSVLEGALKSPLLPARGAPLSSSGRNASGDKGDRHCVSVNDIRRAFEKAEQSLSQSMATSSDCGGSPCSSSSGGHLLRGSQGNKAGSSSSSSGGLSAPSHNRMSSLDSTTSEESSIPTPHYYGSVSSLLSGQTSNLKDHYGSISSLASSTSLISPQELQGLIDEANQSLEESGTPSHEIMVIVLHREFMSGSIGITLAGGADYESKDITVHKVIPGTLADRDGRIQKGDRVLSINGRSTKGVTHREALSILKAPRAEVVLVLSRSRSVTPAEGSHDYASSSAAAANPYSYVNISSGRPPKILESPLDSKSLLSDLKFVDVPRGPPTTVVLKKEGTGLGFSLEGGKDSPLGDRPLTIKKIFTGGAADKTKVLRVGDEILSVNNADCTRMSRIEAWNFMKKLSDGTASLIVRQKLADGSGGVGVNSKNREEATAPAAAESDAPGKQEEKQAKVLLAVESREKEKGQVIVGQV